MPGTLVELVVCVLILTGQYTDCSGGKQIYNISVPNGVTVRLPCGSLLGQRLVKKDGFRLKWTLNGVSIFTTRNARAKDLTYTVEKTQVGSYEYRCSAVFDESDSTTADCTIYLNVSDSDMTVVTKTSKNDARLPCSAGDQSKVTWYKEMSKKEEIERPFGSGSDLIIAQAATSDSGVYICEVVTANASVTDIHLKYVRLTVNEEGTTGTIVAAVVGTVLFLFLVIGITAICRFKRRYSAVPNTTDGSADADKTPDEN